MVNLKKFLIFVSHNVLHKQLTQHLSENKFFKAYKFRSILLKQDVVFLGMLKMENLLALRGTRNTIMNGSPCAWRFLYVSPAFHQRMCITRIAPCVITIIVFVSRPGKS